MTEKLRRQIVREFPELAAGYHMPVMAEITAINDAPKTGGINDNYRPRLAADVQLINSDYQPTEIKLEAVPVSIMGGGDERGFFALPKRGTIVEIAWLNGSPERPFVRSILGDRQALPHIDTDTMSWQQSEASYQRTDSAGNWQRHTDQKISDHATRYEQTAAEAISTLGNEIRRVLRHSVEDIDGKKQIEATAIHLLSATVANIIAAGSINQAACENITRSAAGDIIDNATGNMKATADKLHLGTETDNLLKILSDTIKALSDTCKAITQLTVTSSAPSSESGFPLNEEAFTDLADTVDALKSKVDGMTL